MQEGLFQANKLTKNTALAHAANSEAGKIVPFNTTFGERLEGFYGVFGGALDGALDAAPTLLASLPESLAESIGVLNPYSNPATMRCVSAFCRMYYHDNTERLGCFGINPGRFGGGLTGISFTDPVILRETCGIENSLSDKRELSAEYVWNVIEQFGGAEAFFANIFLSAVCPLGFVKKSVENGGKEVNYNFYDDKALFRAVKPFIVETMHEQLALGLRRDVAVCFGTGKLQSHFDELNKEYVFFERIIALEHPRFIMQYRRTEVPAYRAKYVATLRELMP